MIEKIKNPSTLRWIRSVASTTPYVPDAHIRNILLRPLRISEANTCISSALALQVNLLCRRLVLLSHDLII